MLKRYFLRDFAVWLLFFLLSVVRFDFLHSGILPTSLPSFHGLPGTLWGQKSEYCYQKTQAEITCCGLPRKGRTLLKHSWECDCSTVWTTWLPQRQATLPYSLPNSSGYNGSLFKFAFRLRRSTGFLYSTDGGISISIINISSETWRQEMACWPVFLTPCTCQLLSLWLIPGQTNFEEGVFKLTCISQSSLEQDQWAEWRNAFSQFTSKY